MPFTTTFASLSSKGFSSDLPVFVDYILEDSQSFTTPSYIDIASGTGGAVILSDTSAGDLYIEGMAGNTLPNFSTATPFTLGTRTSQIDKNGTYAISSPSLTASGVSSIYYAATANSWSLQTTIGATGTYGTFGAFGQINQNGDVVAVCGETAGFVNEIEISNRTGASTWSYTDTITDNASGSERGFGAESDRLDFNTVGDILIVGNPRIAGTYTLEGRAYIYEESGGVWSLTATLQSPDTPTQNDWQFGESVKMNTAGDSVIISAPKAFGTGASYRFEKSGASWVHTATFQPIDQLEGQTLLSSGIKMTANKDNHNTVLMDGQVASTGAYGKGRILVGQLGSGVYLQTQTLAQSSAFLGRGGLSITNDASKFVTTDITSNIYLYARA